MSRIFIIELNEWFGSFEKSNGMKTRTFIIIIMCHWLRIFKFVCMLNNVLLIKKNRNYPVIFVKN